MTAFLAPPLHGQEQPTRTSKAVNLADQRSGGTNQQVPEEVLKELSVMKKRIEQLETELKRHESSEQAETTANASSSSAPPPGTMALLPAEGAGDPAASDEKPKKAEPFAFADWTWLNGNPRTKEPAFDSKFFTPEVRVDVAYHYDFNHPKDDTIGG